MQSENITLKALRKPLIGMIRTQGVRSLYMGKSSVRSCVHGSDIASSKSSDLPIKSPQRTQRCPGLGSTLYRDVFFSCIYWSSYELLKRTFFANERPSLQFTMVAGAAAGSTAAAITLPFDVIKTHRWTTAFKSLSEMSYRNRKVFVHKAERILTLFVMLLHSVLGKWS